MTETGSVDRKDRVEVTGQGLILRKMEWWVKLIEDMAFKISSFKRLDMALDIRVNTDYAIREIFLASAI